MALNLKDPGAIEIIHRLLADYDVVIVGHHQELTPEQIEKIEVLS